MSEFDKGERPQLQSRRMDHEPSQDELLEASRTHLESQRDPKYLKELAQETPLPTHGSGALTTASEVGVETAQERAARLGLEVVEAPRPDKAIATQARKRKSAWPFGARLTALLAAIGLAGTGAAVAIGGGGQQEESTPESGGAANAPTQEATNQPDLPAPTAMPTDVEVIPTNPPTAEPPTPEPTVEVSYAEKLAQAPVDISISPSLASSVNVLNPSGILSIVHTGLLFRAGQMDSYPTNQQEITDRMLALGEGADFGGIDPTKGVDIKIIDLSEVSAYPDLSIVRTTHGGVPLVEVDAGPGEGGRTSIIIAINGEGYKTEVCRADTSDSSCIKTAVEEGLINAGADLGTDIKGIDSLQGADYDRAHQYRNWMTSLKGGKSSTGMVFSEDGKFYISDFVAVISSQ